MKIGFSLLALCLWAVSGGCQDPPNIVVIMADDMGFDDVSFHGSKQFLTPNIDAIGFHGLILNNLYTPPMCTPSRAAFMTGKYPIHTGTQHYVVSNEQPWGLRRNLTTIAEIFRGAGYSTHMVGKWHLGHAYKDLLPTNRGFDSHYGYFGGYVDYYQRRSQMPVPNYTMGYDFRRNLDIECADRGTYMTDLLTTEAEAVISAKDAEKPLFLVVNHLAPHTANEDEPLQAPQEVIDRFQYIADENKRIYAAMVSKLDESVGNITRALDAKGILNNTILIFYADNGAPTIGFFGNSGSNWPMRGQKNTPWEGGIRVAATIWSPLLQTRREIFRQNMHVSDWLPTLASAAGINLSPDLQLDGLDLWEDLSQASQATFDREIVHMLDDIWGVTSYLSGNFKYINGTTNNGFASDVVSFRPPLEADPRNIDYAAWVLNSDSGQVLAKYDQKPLTPNKIKKLRKAAQIKCGQSKVEVDCNPLQEECLYDLRRDPCEMKNLATQPKYADVLRQMRKAVAGFRASAVPPENLPGVPDGNPSLHDCTWTWFMEEPPMSAPLECGYFGRPCGEM